ncbi:MAG: PilZ domain-containing protein [Proteobacteria bacterium]|nr:PilZ domain-containing protein [Pseudomonadota bacterium]
MGYSGAAQAAQCRKLLGGALEALQTDPRIPEDVKNVAESIARAISALFEAEHASSEPDGKASLKHALSSLSQSLALLQDVRSGHTAVAATTKALAKAMSELYPLSNVPTMRPSRPGSSPGSAQAIIPGAAPLPRMRPAAAPEPRGPRENVEANVGATTESNFFVGFSGEIADGGIFVATYNTLAKNSLVKVLITLPGGFETHVDGVVRFVRDPMDFTVDSEPGIGIQFQRLDADARELIMRFIRKRPPLFYDD